MTKALAAEFVGTFMLVASVVAAAVFSFPNAGILGVAFSIGFTVMAMVFAIGHLSGGHYNPAVTLGLTIAKRFDAAAVVPYIVSQCLGGIAAAFVFYLIATGKIALFILKSVENIDLSPEKLSVLQIWFDSGLIPSTFILYSRISINR